MMEHILVKTFPEPEFERREILRYAGYPAADKTVTAIMEQCLLEARGKFRYAVCWREVPITFGEDFLDLGGLKTVSAALRKNLRECRRAVLFAATVGLEIDRLTAKYSRLSPVKALMMQAIGAERIESLCDAFCDSLRDVYPKQRPRFSPGYGDLPLEMQREIFTMLDCPRKIGLTLNESLLMSPTKSVTAIVGITDQDSDCNTNKCSTCEKTDCTFKG